MPAKPPKSPADKAKKKPAKKTARIPKSEQAVLPDVKAPPAPEEEAVLTSGLSDRQERFCQEYVNCMNITEAYMRAYKVEKRKVANTCGARLMANASIQERIAEIHAPILDRYNISAERVLHEIATIAYSDMRDFVSIDAFGQPFIDLEKTPDRAWAALAGVEVTDLPPVTVVEGGQEIQRQHLRTKIKVHDKLAALKLLGERTKAIQGPPPPTVEVTVKTESVDMNQLARKMAFIMAKAAKEKGKTNA